MLERKKVLYAPSAMAALLIALSVVVAAAGLFLVFGGSPSRGWRFIAAGCIGMSLGACFRRSRCIEATDEQIVIRLAPFRPREKIPLKDIVAVRRPAPEWLEIDVHARGTRPRCLKVHVGEVKNQPLEPFISWLSRHVRPSDRGETVTVIRVA